MSMAALDMSEKSCCEELRYHVTKQGERIVAVERDHLHLNNTVDDLRTDLKEMISSLRDLTTEVAKRTYLESLLTKAGRWIWLVFGAFGGVIYHRLKSGSWT